jgi:heat shock protein HtpX
VLAHELSHIANRDVLVMTVASFFAMIAAVLTRVGSTAACSAASAATATATTPVPVWLIVLRRLDRDLLPQPDPDLAISRYREFAADRGSALITGAPEQPDERAAEDRERDHRRFRSRTCARSRA